MPTSVQLLEKLQAHFTDPQLYKRETVQSLWSGYGEIARYFSPKTDRSLIVKCISPPSQQAHPRGWNTQASHIRKLQSYKVEAHFYRHYASQCDELCKVPKLITDFCLGEQQVLVLEDLNSVGFSVRKSAGNLEDVALGIKWLAYFHARFMQTSGDGLWPIGSYWHLATRQDEFTVMQNSELKTNANVIDERLNQANFKTLVHGDAKLANFCLADEQSVNQLAAVDFQYVGVGMGVKDLAYFLGACFDQEALFKHEESILNLYFSELQKACECYQADVDFTLLENEWRTLYCFAWADFYRFLLGWAPDHYKINPYMQHQTQTVFAQLDKRSLF